MSAVINFEAKVTSSLCSNEQQVKNGETAKEVEKKQVNLKQEWLMDRCPQTVKCIEDYSIVIALPPRNVTIKPFNAPYCFIQDLCVCFKLYSKTTVDTVLDPAYRSTAVFHLLRSQASIGTGNLRQCSRIQSLADKPLRQKCTHRRLYISKHSLDIVFS